MRQRPGDRGRVVSSTCPRKHRLVRAVACAHRGAGGSDSSDTYARHAQGWAQGLACSVPYVRVSDEPLVIPPRILAGDFAGWLRDAMTERQMSYRMLAIQAGIDHTSVYRLASGDRLPSLNTAVAIIRVFHEPGWVAQPPVAPANRSDALDAAPAGGAS